MEDLNLHHNYLDMINTTEPSPSPDRPVAQSWSVLTFKIVHFVYVFSSYTGGNIGSMFTMSWICVNSFFIRGHKRTVFCKVSNPFLAVRNEWKFLNGIQWVSVQVFPDIRLECDKTILEKCIIIQQLFNSHPLVINHLLKIICNIWWMQSR